MVVASAQKSLAFVKEITLFTLGAPEFLRPCSALIPPAVSERNVRWEVFNTSETEQEEGVTLNPPAECLVCIRSTRSLTNKDCSVCVRTSARILQSICLADLHHTLTLFWLVFGNCVCNLGLLWKRKSGLPLCVQSDGRPIGKACTYPLFFVCLLCKAMMG